MGFALEPLWVVQELFHFIRGIISSLLIQLFGGLRGLLQHEASDELILQFKYSKFLNYKARLCLKPEITQYPSPCHVLCGPAPILVPVGSDKLLEHLRFGLALCKKNLMYFFGNIEPAGRRLWATGPPKLPSPVVVLLSTERELPYFDKATL